MSRFAFTIALAVLGTLLMSCSRKGLTSGSIRIDGSVPSDQAALIQDDYDGLASIDYSPGATYDDLVTMTINDFSGPTIAAWAQQRVQVIVGQTFDTGSRVTSSSNGGRYPYVFSEQPANLGASSDPNVVTVMINLGAYYYLKGVKSQQMYSISTDSGPIDDNSPRVGLVQIGEGMFTANRIKSSPLTSSANKVLRRAVERHEERHDDGNGQYAAFPHANCPADHPYYPSVVGACEQNSDGPYAVQAMMVRLGIAACGDCNSTELEGLRRLQLDYESRMINAQYHDPSPEAF